jgi:hypothetical protein
VEPQPLGGVNEVPAAGSLTVSVAGSLSVATLSRQGRELFTRVCAYAGWEAPPRSAAPFRRSVRAKFWDR